MKPTSWMILTGALCLPGMDQAAALSYSYLEAGYGQIELDDDGGVEADGEGYRVAGSVAIGPTYHLVAEYSSADLEVEGAPIDADIDTISVGFGYNFPINPRADLIGRILYVESELQLDSPFFSVEDDENGYGLQMRIRGEVAERLQLEGGIDYVDLGEDETSLVVEGRYFLTGVLALGAGVELADDSTTYGVTLRFNFGARAAR